ncbi:MAG TPA: hypothetical protein VGK74_21740 [Symbiobacteriaceae bacterium]|jgi:polyhydroxyalkanoate synthesis regulator phasin
MVVTRKWAAAAGAVLVAGTLLAGGVALADSNTANPNSTNPTAVTAPVDKAGHLDDMVKTGKMTPAEADVARQLMALRKSAMTQLKVNEKSLLDQAVKDGKITQEQADKFAQRHGGRRNRHADGKGMGMNRLTKDELQAKLADAVKSGKMTQQQADKVMEKWQQHQTNAQ